MAWSRYEDVPIEYGVYRGQLVRGKAIRRVPYKQFAWTPHKFKEGERIELVADSFYGDPFMWPIIADANPEHFWFGNFGPSDVIRVPYV